jgi:hypothetical protein
MLTATVDSHSFSQLTLPRAPLVAKSLFVIVHPHFNIISSDASYLVGRRQGIEADRYSSKLTALALENEFAQQMCVNLDLMHRFYKHEIDRIQRIPGAVLAIVRSEADYFSGNDFSTSSVNGIPLEVLYSLGSYQSRLIKHASRLKNRFVLIRATERAVGQAIERIARHVWQVDPRTMPTYIFGEYRNACVNVTFESMLASGFSEVELLKGKSAP